MSKPYKRSDGQWAQALELPRGADGKRRRKVVYSRTKSGLAEKVRKATKEVAVMGDMQTTSPTLARWMRRWMDTMLDDDLRPKTRANYEHMTGLIVAGIGGVRLNALKPSHVRALHNYVINEHVRKDGKTIGLSRSTAGNAHRVLKVALNAALAEGLVMRNVAELVKEPRSRSASHKRYLTADESATLLASVASDRRAAIRWSLALMMAMRQGECLGLRADHVDLENGTITVQWQLQQFDDPPSDAVEWIPTSKPGYYLTEVKTAAGERVLPMPDELWEMMRRFVPDLAPDDFVCGPGPRDDSADRRAWKRALKTAGLPDVNLHSARHSTLTLLAKLGVPGHIRQRIAGHASLAVTEQVYTHADMDDMRQAIGKVGAAMQIEG